MDQHETRGQRVRRARRARDLTQEQLAQAVGMTAKTLANIEADRRAHADKIAAVMAYLDLPGEPDETRSLYPVDVQAIGDVVMAYLDQLDPAARLEWQRRFIREITGRTGSSNGIEVGNT